MPVVRFLATLLPTLLAALPAALPVGHSVQGRAIRPVVLGSAPAAHRLLVVGCIHGNEPAGMAITRALLRTRPLPGTEIVVVPTVNPDGCVALHTRGNAHGVDLNRNFPSNWARIGGPGSFQYSGPRPLSEPESRYFVALVRALQPALTVVFHQHEDVVRAWGGSIPTARHFAALLGGVLPYASMRWPYGTAANWQNHRYRGTASFVVELPAGAVPASLVPRYVRALRELAASGVSR
jgi:murein peptide amidase A